MFAYCGNNPVNRSDPTGQFFLTATLGGVALWKICVAAVAAVTVYVVADTLVRNPPTFPSISLPKIEAKPKADTKTKDIAPAIPKSKDKPKKNQAIFPLNPIAFNPKGLVMKEFPGTKNGKVIEWRDISSNTKIFEWNEDFKNGSHYHAVMIGWDGKHNGVHYKPGSPVPEPWDTMYFGGK